MAPVPLVRYGVTGMLADMAGRFGSQASSRARTAQTATGRLCSEEVDPVAGGLKCGRLTRIRAEAGSAPSMTWVIARLTVRQGAVKPDRIRGGGNWTEGGV